MNANRLSAFATAVLIASAASSAAAQDARAELARKIAVAQGLTEQFDQQFAQQREAMKGYAEKLIEQSAASDGGQPNPLEKAALARLVERHGEMFSGSEITAAWVAQYGKDLSLQDLQAILRYYESPIGRKDIAATKSAMPAVTFWMTQEAQTRAAPLLEDFVADLQAARK